MFRPKKNYARGIIPDFPTTIGDVPPQLEIKKVKNGYLLNLTSTSEEFGFQYEQMVYADLEDLLSFVKGYFTELKVSKDK